MASFAVEINHDSAMNHEDAKQARAVARTLHLTTKSAKYNYVQDCRRVQKEARFNKSTITARDCANPHRATRVAKRSCLSQGTVEAEADMPTWSRGVMGRKPSVSPNLQFCQSSEEVAEAYNIKSDDRRIEDAETTAAEVTDSGADSSDSQDSMEVPEPESVDSVNGGSGVLALPIKRDSEISIDSFPPLPLATPKENDTQEHTKDIAHNLKKQVEQEVSEIKAVVEAAACAHLESIVVAAKMQAEREARAIKDQAFADACTLKARVESQAQAKANATLAEMQVSEERERTRKATVGLRQAKDLDQQRTQRQCKQNREERCFHRGLDEIRSQVEAECCEIKEKALAEAKAANARAVAEARAIRAKARSSAKLEDRRRQGTELVTATETREDESPAELTAMRSQPERQPVEAFPVSAAVAQDTELPREPVDAFPASVAVTQDAELPLVDIDAGWEVLPDSSLESIPGSGRGRWWWSRPL